MPWIQTMVEISDQSNTNIGIGKAYYAQFCAGCHGADRNGGEFMGNVPSLLGLKDRIQDSTFHNIISSGKGVMPAFSWMGNWQIEALKAYLFDLEEKDLEVDRNPDAQRKYTSTGYIKFKGPEGFPAIEPPWGTLSAIDMEKAEIKWQVPFGEHTELTKRGMEITGTENYGGPAITSNGLLFIASTQDERFRVFDQENGKILFETQLPAAGYATPSIYTVDDVQYVVVACGGGKLGTKSGDFYVAFSLLQN